MIKKLPDQQVFKGLGQMKVLYLHENLINQWACLNSLNGLTELIHLTLSNNPVTALPGYRHYLVNSLRSLKALDEYIVTDEERIEDTANGSRFRAMSQYMKIHIPKFGENMTAE